MNLVGFTIAFRFKTPLRIPEMNDSVLTHHKLTFRLELKISTSIFNYQIKIITRYQHADSFLLQTNYDFYNSTSFYVYDAL